MRCFFVVGRGCVCLPLLLTAACNRTSCSLWSVHVDSGVKQVFETFDKSLKLQR